MKTWLSRAVALCAGMLAAGTAFSFPDKPVTIVVPFTPGGAVDIVARAVAAGLTERWSQPVVVENKPGAGGAIGIQTVLRSAADGYTLLLGSIGPITINPSLSDVGYDVGRDLTPIALLAKTPTVLVAGAQAPVNNVTQFVQWVKSKPMALNYGSAGNGNITHLAAAYFLSTAGATASHIPYKGSAPAITDLIGGQLDFLFDVVPTAQPHVKSGKFKALAVTTLRRSPVLPDVPTLDELGYKGFDVSSWFALFAPKGTPAAVIDQINAAANATLLSEKTRERLSAIGAEVEGGTPGKLGEFVQSETARWKHVIDQHGLKAP